MIFKIYTIYDPLTESFGEKLHLAPLGPEEMQEQFRRAHLTMDEKNKAFIEDKKAMYLGQFDDVTGRIYQEKEPKVVYEYKREKIEKVDGEKEPEECQEPSPSIQEQKDLN